MKDANLEDTNLKLANLENAKLEGANLKDADVRSAKKLTEEQIKVAKNGQQAYGVNKLR
ncbi:MAG: pentapeptide repeat-containing protein [Nostoc sp. LLA-1]|nr:pentapeptide repeat-containing protein [Cyanocohniella sp. LLY]